MNTIIDFSTQKSNLFNYLGAHKESIISFGKTNSTVSSAL